MGDSLDSSHVHRSWHRTGSRIPIPEAARDTSHRSGNRALDRFEVEGSVPISSFVPQLWMPEMVAFPRELRGGRVVCL
jgi:hypothetical protein